MAMTDNEIVRSYNEAAEPVNNTPLQAEKTSAFGFDNIIAVLAAGEFDTVTFENAEDSVTVRRKTANALQL